VRVLWFPADETSPYVPFPNPFVLRSWDVLAGDAQTTLGTDQKFREKYSGPLPTGSPGTVCGTADQWSNGVSYATFISGGYSCSCLGVIVPTFVNFITSPDNSLVVSPTTGDVAIEINTAHSNIWTVDQTFAAALPTSLAVAFRMAPLQTAPIFEVEDSSGESRFSADAPVDNDRGVSLAGWDASGNLRWHLGDDLLRMDGNGTTDFFQLEIGTGVRMSFGRLLLTSPAGIVTIGSKLACGLPYALTEGTAEDCTLLVDNSAADTALTIKVRGQVDLSAADIFLMDAAGNAGVAGTFSVGQALTTSLSQLSVAYGPGTGGLFLQPAPGVGAWGPPIQVNDLGGTPTFGVGGEGQLKTNQTTPVVGFVGTLFKRLPLYDEGGVLIGYVPVYSSID
jgi:hypothetical protein